jgi:23S rRNA (pseudouridine1915-N3)-methyltransferase
MAMKFRVVVIGKPRHTAIASAIADYEERAARYWPLEIVQLRDDPAGARSADAVRAAEAKRILERLTGATVVACDERGKGMTSIEFAGWLRRLQERAGDVDVIVGGAAGLDPSVRERATQLLSLAPWTLSHELARLVLAEQLYRAGTIVRGEPYHRA